MGLRFVEGSDTWMGIDFTSSKNGWDRGTELYDRRKVRSRNKTDTKSDQKVTDAKSDRKGRPTLSLIVVSGMSVDFVDLRLIKVARDHVELKKLCRVTCLSCPRPSSFFYLGLT
jgi:hypothetical protein